MKNLAPLPINDITRNPGSSTKPENIVITLWERCTFAIGTAKTYLVVLLCILSKSLAKWYVFETIWPISVQGSSNQMASNPPKTEKMVAMPATIKALLAFKTIGTINKSGGIGKIDD